MSLIGSYFSRLIPYHVAARAPSPVTLDHRTGPLRAVKDRVLADRRMPLLARLSSTIWLTADQLAGIVYSLKVCHVSICVRWFIIR